MNLHFYHDIRKSRSLCPADSNKIKAVKHVSILLIKAVCQLGWVLSEAFISVPQIRLWGRRALGH